jgi:hypothetical protein
MSDEMSDPCIGSFDLATQVGSSDHYCTGCGMKDPPIDEDRGTVLPHVAAKISGDVA